MASHRHKSREQSHKSRRRDRRKNSRHHHHRHHHHKKHKRHHRHQSDGKGESDAVAQLDEQTLRQVLHSLDVDVLSLGTSSERSSLSDEERLQAGVWDKVEDEVKEDGLSNSPSLTVTTHEIGQSRLVIASARDALGSHEGTGEEAVEEMRERLVQPQQEDKDITIAITTSSLPGEEPDHCTDSAHNRLKWSTLYQTASNSCAIAVNQSETGSELNKDTDYKPDAPVEQASKSSLFDGSHAESPTSSTNKCSEDGQRRSKSRSRSCSQTRSESRNQSWTKEQSVQGDSQYSKSEPGRKDRNLSDNKHSRHRSHLRERKRKQHRSRSGTVSYSRDSDRSPSREREQSHSRDRNRSCSRDRRSRSCSKDRDQYQSRSRDRYHYESRYRRQSRSRDRGRYHARARDRSHSRGRDQDRSRHRSRSRERNGRYSKDKDRYHNNRDLHHRRDRYQHRDHYYNRDRRRLHRDDSDRHRRRGSSSSRSRSPSRRRYTSQKRRRRSYSRSRGRSDRSYSHQSDDSTDSSDSSRSGTEHAGEGDPHHGKSSPNKSITDAATPVDGKLEKIALLTEFCRQLAEGTDTTTAVEQQPVVHPFAVGQQPSLIYHDSSWKTPSQMVLESNAASTEGKEIVDIYPVSSGLEHPREENQNLNVACGASESLPISQLVTQRLQAQEQFLLNPHDPLAMAAYQYAESQVGQWCKSQLKPGQFTGQSALKPLTKADHQQGIQAWARKNMFSGLAPVMSGFGMKMLKRMGWQEGMPLGKAGIGLVEPIELSVKVDRQGLATQQDNQPPVVPAVPASLQITGKSAPTCFQGKHPVSALQELCTHKHWGPPVYELISSTGKSHKMTFLFQVTIPSGTFRPTCGSNSKKMAKAQAAIACLTSLGLMTSTEVSQSQTLLPNT